MKLILKPDNGMNRRSINNKVFYTTKPTEVEEGFEFKKFSYYLKQYEEPTLKKNEEVKEEIEESHIEEKEPSTVTKKQLIESIMEEFPGVYTKTELNKLNKDVLELTLKGELE